MELLVVQSEIECPLETVWSYFTDPKHIQNWNFASDDWHCPEATSVFQVGGKFNNKMAAKDGSFAFDYWGIFQEISPNKKLKFSLGEDLGSSRYVEVAFISEGRVTRVIEGFVPETENPIELQQQGWQMILDNFKKYCESSHTQSK
jgi:uncharacterized protein YndB with AHSA1/START domain